jgi:hypothetical protein
MARKLIFKQNGLSSTGAAFQVENVEGQNLSANTTTRLEQIGTSHFSLISNRNG